MAPFDMKIECPRCNRVHLLPQGSPGLYCNCHLFCSSGSKESDCAVTEYNYSGQLKFPVGSHQNSSNEGDDVLHRAGYCSTHTKYTYKPILFLEPNWRKWYKNRAPERLRDMKKR